ncbi:MAG: hypothetical protein ACI9WU_004288 [Myxococcota bacterium]|jgi:hypothetical protein
MRYRSNLTVWVAWLLAVGCLDPQPTQEAPAEVRVEARMTDPGELSSVDVAAPFSALPKPDPSSAFNRFEEQCKLQIWPPPKPIYDITDIDSGPSGFGVLLTAGCSSRVIAFTCAPYAAALWRSAPIPDDSTEWGDTTRLLWCGMTWGCNEPVENPVHLRVIDPETGEEGERTVTYHVEFKDQSGNNGLKCADFTPPNWVMNRELPQQLDLDPVREFDQIVEGCNLSVSPAFENGLCGELYDQLQDQDGFQFPVMLLSCCPQLEFKVDCHGDSGEWRATSPTQIGALSCETSATTRICSLPYLVDGTADAQVVVHVRDPTTGQQASRTLSYALSSHAPPICD